MHRQTGKSTPTSLSWAAEVSTRGELTELWGIFPLSLAATLQPLFARVCICIFVSVFCNQISFGGSTKGGTGRISPLSLSATLCRFSPKKSSKLSGTTDSLRLSLSLTEFVFLYPWPKKTASYDDDDIDDDDDDDDDDNVGGDEIPFSSPPVALSPNSPNTRAAAAIQK